jgi:hypothetical protein
MEDESKAVDEIASSLVSSCPILGWFQWDRYIQGVALVKEGYEPHYQTKLAE